MQRSTVSAENTRTVLTQRAHVVNKRCSLLTRKVVFAKRSRGGGLCKRLLLRKGGPSMKEILTAKISKGGGPNGQDLQGKVLTAKISRGEVQTVKI